MSDDLEIGRVVSVDTAQVTIELGKELKALTRATAEEVYEVARINSYAIIPVGARRLVAMVTKVTLTEEAELKADRTMVTLPSARRIMRATLIGTIQGSEFQQGVAVFPVLDNPVLLASRSDLECIFGAPGSTAEIDPPDPSKPGYCVRIGESSVFERYPVRIDPDAFFGKHAAVLGSTGSGKSCTIASILQSVLAHKAVKRTRVIILDTNGEYSSVVGLRQEGEGGVGSPTRATLRLSAGPAGGGDGGKFEIPYWFMNSDDCVRLLRASQGVQRPVLLEALRLSRNESVVASPATVIARLLTSDLAKIWRWTESDGKTSKAIFSIAKGLRERLEKPDLKDGFADVGLDRDAVLKALSSVEQEAKKLIENGTYPMEIHAVARQAIQGALDPVLRTIRTTRPGAAVSADAPVPFHKGRFRDVSIEAVLRNEESGGTRVRDYCGSMLLRLDRLLADPRFEFLLGPVDAAWPEPTHALATFMRDILGLQSAEAVAPPLSDEAGVPEGTLGYYDRQRKGTEGHDVVIVDLSLLASEVLENVTALIGRLVLDFLQRLGEQDSGAWRGKLPVVLVLEEAQNYIGETRKGEEESISRAVFERIAREGRKFGLGLLVASQRPSELSKTVLSQCSSFVVHRLQNPEDLRYFKEIVPGVYEPLLAQLPALAPQTALVLGSCVRAPALVRIRDADPKPDSKDPRFWEYWAQERTKPVPVEEVCATWEGKAPGIAPSGDRGAGGPPGAPAAEPPAPPAPEGDGDPLPEFGF